jgi:hypothetical protein
MYACQIVVDKAEFSGASLLMSGTGLVVSRTLYALPPIIEAFVHKGERDDVIRRCWIFLFLSGQLVGQSCGKWFAVGKMVISQ